MKAKVDSEVCIGCELCCDTCPAVFEFNGVHSTVKVEPIPEGEEDCVREAASNCPVEAIAVEE